MRHARRQLDTPGESDIQLQRAPGKRTRSQDLAPASTMTTRQLLPGPAATAADPFDFGFDDDHEPRTSFEIAGMRLDASSGFEAFQTLESLLESARPGGVAELRDAASNDVALLAPFAGLAFGELLPEEIALLETIARNYVSFLPILMLEPALQPAALLRHDLVTLGYGEKPNARNENPKTHPTPGEIDCGGNISFELYELLSLVLAAIHARRPDLNVTLTGGNDVAHSHYSDAGDPHHQGRAMDLTISPCGAADLDDVVAILESVGLHATTRWTADIACYIDEYRNPSSIATAGHFHIQVAK
jgi:hypothetical protein